MHGNVAAGSNHFGFFVQDDPAGHCGAAEEGVASAFTGNSAKAARAGLCMFEPSPGGCMTIADFQVSKTIEAGIYFERNVRHLTIRNVVASDNYVGMVILPVGQGVDATVTVSDSLFVGDSAYGGCGGKAYTGTCRGGHWSGCQSYTGKARIGLMAAVWNEGSKQFPRSSKTFPYHDAMFSDSSFHGAGVTVRDVVFANWTLVDGCYDSRHAISTNPMGPSLVRTCSGRLLAD